MKKEPITVLSVKKFPRSLMAKCKAKAALQDEGLGEFVIASLREATQDIPDPKPRSNKA